MGLSDDLALVENSIDLYLKQTLKLKIVDDPATGKMAEREYKVIVDDGRPNDIQPLMKSSEGKTATLMAQVQGDSNSELYWSEYGRLVHDAMPMGIRCDACTALAFYLLKGKVSGSITVIEQDQGNKDGHWFLLVGCPEETKIAYPDKFPRGCFVVDLWGVGVKTQRNETTDKFKIGKSAVKPAWCVYSCTGNQLKKKIYIPGITTVPTKDQFVEETTVPGIIGDKSRSGELQALDRALGNFHTGSGDISAVNTALEAWIGAKSKRQGEEIVSIRKEGIERLKKQIKWLTT